MSLILVFHREALSILRYFPGDDELVLGMSLLELHYILQIYILRNPRMKERN